MHTRNYLLIRFCAPPAPTPRGGCATLPRGSSHTIHKAERAGWTRSRARPAGTNKKVLLTVAWAGALDVRSEERSPLLHWIHQSLIPQHRRRVRLQGESRSSAEASVGEEHVRSVEDGCAWASSGLGVPAHEIDRILGDAKSLRRRCIWIFCVRTAPRRQRSGCTPLHADLALSNHSQPHLVRVWRQHDSVLGGACSKQPTQGQPARDAGAGREQGCHGNAAAPAQPSLASEASRREAEMLAQLSYFRSFELLLWPTSSTTLAVRACPPVAAIPASPPSSPTSRSSSTPARSLARSLTAPQAPCWRTRTAVRGRRRASRSPLGSPGPPRGRR